MYHFVLCQPVDNISIRKDTNIQIRSEDLVEATNLLISKESVRHPHLAGVCYGQVPDFV